MLKSSHLHTASKMITRKWIPLYSPRIINTISSTATIRLHMLF
uniref:Uncharacterized protein n=1 Tax=Anguilla anguilla TaxID=7936 RepID=A0A0E9U1G6_ANGAN